MNLIYNLGIIIPLAIISTAFFVYLFDKGIHISFNIYSITMLVIVLAVIVLWMYSSFLTRNIDNDKLKTFIIEENKILITTNSNKYDIQKTDITKCLVNIDFSSDWIGYWYHVSYHLTININENLNFSFNSITFGSIKKFLRILDYMPNCVCTTSSNLIPIEKMQSILKTKKGLNFVQVLYYSILDFINTATPLVMLFTVLALGILVWFIVSLIM